MLGLGGFFWLLILSSPARSAPIEVGCAIYLSNENRLSNEIFQELHRHNDEAARICFDHSGRISRYYAVSSVWRTNRGICKFSMTPQTPGSDSVDRSVIFMSPATRCPSQADVRYVETKNITDGTFLAILNFWRKITISKVSFDNAFNVETKSEIAGRDHQCLMEQIFNNNRDKPNAIRFIGEGSIPPNIVDEGYQIILDDSEDATKHWSLYLDFYGSEFRIVRVYSEQY